MEYFKGGEFINRYKIIGALTTLSPLHIGDGGMVEDPRRFPAQELNSEDGTPRFTTVATDAGGCAYIPGSSLKGGLRGWLNQVFADMFKLGPPNTPQRALDLQKFAVDNQHNKNMIRNELRMIEFLFGTGLNAGKLEFWDAPMQTKPALPSDQSAIAYGGYDPVRGTTILKAVAIDPRTGAAAANKLYNYEVVPKGAQFEITVCGQNLEEDELGMLFFALEGFNSFIYPVTLGAMGGIGYGRFSFESKQIRFLDKDNFQDWMKDAVKTGHGGYAELPLLSETDRQNRIQCFKSQFLSHLEKEAD